MFAWHFTKRFNVYFFIKILNWKLQVIIESHLSFTVFSHVKLGQEILVSICSSDFSVLWFFNGIIQADSVNWQLCVGPFIIILLLFLTITSPRFFQDFSSGSVLWLCCYRGHLALFPSSHSTPQADLQIYPQSSPRVHCELNTQRIKVNKGLLIKHGDLVEENIAKWTECIMIVSGFVTMILWLYLEITRKLSGLWC